MNCNLTEHERLNNVNQKAKEAQRQLRVVKPNSY